MLVGGVLHRRWTGEVTEKDGGVCDVIQVVIPSEYRKPLMHWRMRDLGGSPQSQEDCAETAA